MSGIFIHPAIEAAVSYWCGTISAVAEPEKLEKFKVALSVALAKIYDSSEGIIEIFSTVPNKTPYTDYEKAGRPSKILINSMKKAKLPLELLPQNVRVELSTSVVTSFADGTLQTLWKEPISYNKR